MIQRIQTVWMVLTAALLGACLSEWERMNGWFAILVAVAALVPLVTVFLFRNRSRQTSLLIASFLPIAGCAGFAIYYGWVVHTLWAYLPLLPLAGLVTNWLALRGVLKDEMLIRDTDRLR